MASNTTTPIRTEAGQFPKGQSGNPEGRPKGSRNKITLLRESLELQLRETAEPEMIEVLQMAISLAKAGDRSMIKLLLDLHMSKSAPEGGPKQDRAIINIFGPKKEDIETVDPEKAGDKRDVSPGAELQDLGYIEESENVES